MSSHVEALTKGIAEKAMAKGIEVAVEVMRALAKDAINGKVDATDIRIAAASLEASAERKRAAAGTANRARRRIGKETPDRWRG